LRSADDTAMTNRYDEEPSGGVGDVPYSRDADHVLEGWRGRGGGHAKQDRADDEIEGQEMPARTKVSPVKSGVLGRCSESEKAESSGKAEGWSRVGASLVENRRFAEDAVQRGRE